MAIGFIGLSFLTSKWAVTFPSSQKNSPSFAASRSTDLLGPEVGEVDDQLGLHLGLGLGCEVPVGKPRARRGRPTRHVRTPHRANGGMACPKRGSRDEGIEADGGTPLKVQEISMVRC